jgi:hypothetical protein
MRSEGNLERLCFYVAKKSADMTVGDYVITLTNDKVENHPLITTSRRRVLDYLACYFALMMTNYPILKNTNHIDTWYKIRKILMPFYAIY